MDVTCAKCWHVLQTASGGTQFALTQVGLSAFVWSETEHQYRPRTFNFYVFLKPVNGYDRRFLSQVCTTRLMLILATSLTWGERGSRYALFGSCSYWHNHLNGRGGGIMKQALWLSLVYTQVERFACQHMQAGSLEFLAGQGFDFNKWIYQGVPFMPADWRKRYSSTTWCSDLQQSVLCEVLRLDSFPSLRHVESPLACVRWP